MLQPEYGRCCRFCKRLITGLVWKHKSSDIAWCHTIEFNLACHLYSDRYYFVLEYIDSLNFLSIYQAKWVTNPFTSKLFSLIQNDTSPNMDDELDFVTYEQTLRTFIY